MVSRGSLRGPKKRQEQKEMSLSTLLGLKRIPAAVSSFPFQYVSKWCLSDHVPLWNLLVGQRVFFARGQGDERARFDQLVLQLVARNQLLISIFLICILNHDSRANSRTPNGS